MKKYKKGVFFILVLDISNNTVHHQKCYSQIEETLN